MENEKSCHNCQFYVQHYAKGTTRRTYLHKVGCGHCLNSDAKFNKRKQFPLSYGCSNWQPIEIQITQRRNSIKTVLKEICEYLELIATILKDDDEYLQ